MTLVFRELGVEDLRHAGRACVGWEGVFDWRWVGVAILVLLGEWRVGRGGCKLGYNEKCLSVEFFMGYCCCSIQVVR